MKLITSLSISAFVLMPAIAFAENSPSSTGTVSKPNLEQPSNAGGEPSNTGGDKSYPDRAAVKKIAAPSSQNGASVKPNEAKDQPGLMEKAKELMGTITGRASSNENESGGQGNPPMGESKK